MLWYSHGRGCLITLISPKYRTIMSSLHTHVVSPRCELSTHVGTVRVGGVHVRGMVRKWKVCLCFLVSFAGHTADSVIAPRLKKTNGPVCLFLAEQAVIATNCNGDVRWVALTSQVLQSPNGVSPCFRSRPDTRCPLSDKSTPGRRLPSLLLPT